MFEFKKLPPGYQAVVVWGAVASLSWIRFVLRFPRSYPIGKETYFSWGLNTLMPYLYWAAVAFAAMLTAQAMTLRLRHLSMSGWRVVALWVVAGLECYRGFVSVPVIWHDGHPDLGVTAGRVLSVVLAIAAVMATADRIQRSFHARITREGRLP